LNRERARGKDIIADRKQRQATIVETFDKLAIDYITDYAKPRTRDWRKTSRLLGVTPEGAIESWARESGQVDKWIFCLTTARLAEDQEIR
jgi:hypothetical protein